MCIRILCAVLLLATSAMAADTALVGQLVKDLDTLQGTLNEAQSTKMNMAFDAKERLAWTFFPEARVGLPLKDLSEKQQILVLDVVKSLLSTSGFEKAEQVRFLETVLHEFENNNPTRDSNLYFLSVFGKPSANGAWGIRWEGHHLSLSWTVVKGEVIASTPQFLGTNPGEVLTGAHKGLRVHKTEEDLGLQLVNTLNVMQKEQCIIAPTAPPEILTRIKERVKQLEDKGLAYSDMTDVQKGLLMSIINEYANLQSPSIASYRLGRLNEAGLDTIKFAWMGVTERGEGHYYRIQGKTFVIEFDNVQNDANHTHTVWRDFEGDFGGDILLDHYQAWHRQ